MEISKQTDYNIFSALVDTMQKKDQQRLRFAKCPKCGRLTPFRLMSQSTVVVKCKRCGSKVNLKK